MYVLAAMLVHKEVLLLNVHLKPKEIENQLDQLGVTTVLHSKERRNQLSHFVDSKASNFNCYN